MLALWFPHEQCCAWVDCASSNSQTLLRAVVPGNMFAKMEAKATSPGRVGKDALVREIFEEIDEDGSGFLEFTEIGDLLDRLGLRINDDEVR
eukprot:COSAG02_NODE_779_length_17271_cov_30.596261_5_plen_92_part_00